MLLVILALFWVVLLTPIVVRRFRDNGTEKSIESFRQEHAVLSRQEYAYSPAHRLDGPDEDVFRPREPSRRPKLKLVHDDDTYQSLETRGSWDEWSDSYSFEDEDRAAPRRAPANRYVAAYSSVPVGSLSRDYDEPAIRRRSMKARRRTVLTRLVLVVAATTVLGFATGVSILEDLAILTWLAFAVYVALALYAVGQGYLFESSLGIRLPRDRTMATVEPLYGDFAGEFGEEADSSFYESQSSVEWRRESPSRYALG
jgi:hypothetical protein